MWNDFLDMYPSQSPACNCVFPHQPGGGDGGGTGACVALREGRDVPLLLRDPVTLVLQLLLLLPARLDAGKTREGRRLHYIVSSRQNWPLYSEINYSLASCN